MVGAPCKGRRTDMSLTPISRAIAAAVGVVALMATIGLTRWPGRGDCPINNPTTSLQAGGAELLVEIAADNHARFCGLAFRDHLPSGSGMLFVYSEEQPLEFWMKDTRLPLALAFIDSDRRIAEIHQLTPDMGEQTVTSATPAHFALETNPGWFNANQVSIGDRVNFDLPRELPIE